MECLERGLGDDAALACETLVSFWDFCLPADCLASEAAPTYCVEKLGRGLGIDAGFACDTIVGASGAALVLYIAEVDRLRADGMCRNGLGGLTGAGGTPAPWPHLHWFSAAKVSRPP